MILAEEEKYERATSSQNGVAPLAASTMARGNSWGGTAGTQERRALHFIAVASSLFIADTTLRHISFVFPAVSRRYVRQQKKEGFGTTTGERKVEEEGRK